MNPEQLFLQSRQSRIAQSSTLLSSSSSPSSSSLTSSIRQKNYELGLFWTELRKRLDVWTTKVLETVETRQDLQDLQEELRTLRHHCLLPILDFAVPQELPPADWRLLHSEFTKCTTLLETIQAQRFPKGKFTFQRYRQEVARRKALGIPLELQQSQRTKSVGVTSTSETSTSASLESVHDATIHILKDGVLQIQPHDGISRLVTSAAVLLRNIQNATIKIDKVLEALHLVNISHTTVIVSQSIASSIHITHCNDCTIKAQSQQLRIHDSHHMCFDVELVAGAILEGSSDIVFQHPVEVRDFDWLRAGVPSPNFKFEEVANEEYYSPAPPLVETTITIEQGHSHGNDAPVVTPLALPEDGDAPKQTKTEDNDEDDDDDEL